MGTAKARSRPQVAAKRARELCSKERS